MESLARIIAAVVLAVPFAQGSIAGTWALPSGKPLAAAEMHVSSGPDDRVALDVSETSAGTSTPIRDYDIDMTKLMHMIVISDDFSTFMHVHPTFDRSDGHFSESLQLDPSRRYYVYADTDPTGLGQQVFRFTLQPRSPAPILHAVPVAGTPSSAQSAAGPYVVTLSGTTLHAGSAQSIDVTIARGGKPAADLQPYLGAAAHAVFIDTATLAYVHIHPVVQGSSMAGMDMGSMPMGQDVQAGPRLTMSVPALAAGTYRLWLEFQGKEGVNTAPFTLVVR